VSADRFLPHELAGATLELPYVSEADLNSRKHDVSFYAEEVAGLLRQLHAHDVQREPDVSLAHFYSYHDVDAEFDPRKLEVVSRSERIHEFCYTLGRAITHEALQGDNPLDVRTVHTLWGSLYLGGRYPSGFWEKRAVKREERRKEPVSHLPHFDLRIGLWVDRKSLVNPSDKNSQSRRHDAHILLLSPDSKYLNR